MRLVAIALLVLFWFGLTADTSAPEIGAALVVTLLVVAAYAGLRRHGEGPTTARPRWLWRALRDLPVRILRETPTALATVFANPRGHFLQVEIGDAGEVELAWTIVGTSIAPISYVVGIDERRRTLLIHELVDTGKPDDEIVWRPR